MTAQTFGSRLRRLMTINRISEAEVLVQTSLDRSTFAQWAAGEVKASAPNITVLAEYFGCDESWLGTGEGEPYPSAAAKDLGSTSGQSFRVITLPGDEHPDRGMQEIAEWIAEQQDGINYWEVIKAQLAREYPEFREWLKKRQIG